MAAKIAQHEKKAADRFDQWADTYGNDRISPWFEHYQSIAMDELDLRPGKSFLDVGCGPGSAVRRAARVYEAAKSCGIDISPKMIDKAKKQSPKTNVIEFVHGSSEAIPYRDEEFDAVLCTCSFHHYQHPHQALKEMKRVLKKGGRMALLDPARDVSAAIWLQDRFRRYFEKSHVKYYTTKEMLDLMQESGFKPFKEIGTYKKIMDHKKAFTGLMLVACAKAKMALISIYHEMEQHFHDIVEHLVAGQLHFLVL